VDERKVGCTGIDAVQSLVGVLLGDLHAEVGAARRQARDGRRRWPSSGSSRTRPCAFRCLSRRRLTASG
jgi:hypothetical protein